MLDPGTRFICDCCDKHGTILHALTPDFYQVQFDDGETSRIEDVHVCPASDLQIPPPDPDVERMVNEYFLEAT